MARALQCVALSLKCKAIKLIPKREKGASKKVHALGAKELKVECWGNCAHEMKMQCRRSDLQ